MFGVGDRSIRNWAAVLVLLLSFSAAVSVAGRGGASTGTGRQLIAFSGVHWNAEGNPTGSQIYIVRANATGLRRATAAGVHEDTDPDWSPNGGRLAFGRREAGGWRIWVMNADGSHPRAVTGTQPLASQPSWSPDGRQLAFVELPSDLPKTGWYAQQLYVVSLETGHVRQLTRFSAFPGGASSPSWSPDGRHILFSGKTSRAEGARPDVWVLAADGSSLRRVLVQAADPAWSPDGRSIAFARRGDLYTAAADGSRVRRITRTRDHESGPSWSPDGAWIAFARDHATKDWKRETVRLYVVTTSGAGMRAVTPANPRFWADAPSWQSG